MTIMAIFSQSPLKVFKMKFYFHELSATPNSWKCCAAQLCIKCYPKGTQWPHPSDTFFWHLQQKIISEQWKLMWKIPWTEKSHQIEVSYIIASVLCFKQWAGVCWNSEHYPGGGERRRHSSCKGSTFYPEKVNARRSIYFIYSAY